MIGSQRVSLLRSGEENMGRERSCQSREFAPDFLNATTDVSTSLDIYNPSAGLLSELTLCRCVKFYLNPRLDRRQRSILGFQNEESLPWKKNRPEEM